MTADTKLKVGDTITGVDVNPYSTTTSKAFMRVDELIKEDEDEEDIRVSILERVKLGKIVKYDKPDSGYPVESKYFKKTNRRFWRKQWEKT